MFYTLCFSHSLCFLITYAAELHSHLLSQLASHSTAPRRRSRRTFALPRVPTADALGASSLRPAKSRRWKLNLAATNLPENPLPQATGISRFEDVRLAGSLGLLLAFRRLDLSM